MENSLPKGWIEVKLGDVFKTTSGGTPSRKNSAYYNGNISWVKSGELNYDFINDTEEKISQEAVEDSSAKVFPRGTLLIALYGATIGKLAFLNIDAATNQAVCGIFKNDYTNIKFLYWYLYFKRPELIEAGAGGAQPNISQTFLKDLAIPLPPLAEQHRIVAKLDTLLGRVTACKSRLEKIPALLKAFRQSVLAVLENDYPEMELSEITDLDVGYAFKSAEFETSGVRLLRGENIEPGKLRWLDTKYFPEDKLSSLKHLFLNSGDIVLAMDRPVISTGLKIATVRKDDLPSVLVQRVCRFRPKEELLPTFLYIQLNTLKFIKHLTHNQTGTQIPHISAKQILSFKVKVPPLEEQKEIVRKVEELFHFADNIEARYQKAKAWFEKIPQAILAKAFRGELVPQNESDEPASALLERIKNERQKSPKSKLAAKQGKLYKENEDLTLAAES